MSVNSIPLTEISNHEPNYGERIPRLIALKHPRKDPFAGILPRCFPHLAAASNLDIEDARCGGEFRTTFRTIPRLRSSVDRATVS